jgi:hypothetical protein
MGKYFMVNSFALFQFALMLPQDKQNMLYRQMETFSDIF